MTSEGPSRWTWTRIALRGIVGVEALLVLTQAALAGQFLSGNSPSRSLHRELGTEVITWVAFAALIVAVLAWRPGRYSGWSIVVTGIGFGTVILQLGYGFEGRVDIHIPLGVAIFALYLTLFLALGKGNEQKTGRL